MNINNIKIEATEPITPSEADLKNGAKTPIVSALEYLLMLLIVLEFNTAYMSFPGIPSIVKNLFLIVLLILFVYRSKNLRIDPIVILLLLGGLFPMLNIAEGNFNNYVRLYLMVFPLLVMYLKVLATNRELVSQLLLKFSNILFIIAIISLFFWILGSQMELISYTVMVPNSWGTERLIPTYYGLYFETQQSFISSSSDDELIRNSGIFNEAPMFNMALCVALSFECFLRKSISKLRIFVLVGTIITTFSTTGYIFLLIIVSMIVYSNLNLQNRRKLVFILFPFLLVMYFSVSAVLQNKKETGETSYNSRSEDIERCIEVGLENPVLGVGLFHAGDEYGNSKTRFGYSNSLFGIFAHGGLYTFALYFFVLFCMPFIYYRHTKDRKMLFLSLCYFILFTFTVSEYRYLTILIMALEIALWESVLNQESTVRSVQ